MEECKSVDDAIAFFPRYNDKRTAIAIAVAVWTPIYGEKKIAREKPYTASLKDGIWTVQGTLPKGWLGGVAIAEIAKEDGRVIAVIHQQ